jgi:tetratricopeptide (TPR) repeat protein
MGLERWQDAISALKQATSINPAYAAAHYDLGIAYENALDMESAIVSLQQAIQIKSNYANARYELGRLYTDAGDTAAAIDEVAALEKVNKRLAEQLLEYIKRAN